MTPVGDDAWMAREFDNVAAEAAKDGDRRFLIKLLEESFPHSESIKVTVEILKGKYPRSKGTRQSVEAENRDLMIALFVLRRQQLGRKPEEAKRDAMRVSPVKYKRGIERILKKWDYNGKRQLIAKILNLILARESLPAFRRGFEFGGPISAEAGWNVREANRMFMRHKSGFVSRESLSQ